MKFLNYDTVLCLSPHPDDVEFSMSGLIKKYKDTKFIVLVLSNGTSSDTSSGISRTFEVQKFWTLLDVNNVDIKFLYGTFDMLDDGTWIGLIEDEMKNIKLDAIFATSTIDSHYEHHITNRILYSLGRNKPVSLIEYKSPSTKDSWEPNLFVDIDNEYEVKLNSLRGSFNSQLDSPYFKSDLIELFNLNYTMCKVGLDKVESFRIIRKIIKG